MIFMSFLKFVSYQVLIVFIVFLVFLDAMMAVVYDLSVLKHFGHIKIIQEKLIKLVKILNYIKFSYTIFCAKMFGCFHYTYCLQDKSTHFDLRVLTNFGLEVSGHRWKSILKLCQLSSFNYFQNVFGLFGWYDGQLYMI